MDAADLTNRFAYHPPSVQHTQRHEFARVVVRATADELDACAPDCREKSLAVTALEEALFWINAAIARHEAREAREASSSGPARR